MPATTEVPGCRWWCRVGQEVTDWDGDMTWGHGARVGAATCGPLQAAFWSQGADCWLRFHAVDIPRRPELPPRIMLPGGPKLF